MQLHCIRHATSILGFGNKKILVDPVLGNKGSYKGIEGVPNKNRNPLTELPVSVKEIIDCDAALVTHTHSDHFDMAASEILPKSIPVLCQPEDTEKLKGHGFEDVIPVIRSREWAGIELIRTAGRHGHGAIAVKMAPVSGFIIKAPGEPVVYITGDTVFCRHIEKVMLRHRPEIVICYCGEAKFNRGKPITMDARDILSVCRTLPDAKIVAVHMEAWNHCRLTRNELREFVLHGINQQVYIPENGEILTFQ